MRQPAWRQRITRGAARVAQCLGQRHPFVQQPRTEASRPFHAVLSSAKSHGGQAAVGLWRLPVASPPPPRPSGYCYHVWKTTEEIKWKHKSATRFLPFLWARHSPTHTHQHRETEPAQLGLLWRGPVGTVALSQDSQQLGLPPNLSSPKELGALGLSPFLPHAQPSRLREMAHQASPKDTQ